MSFIKNILSADNESSSKRLVCIVLVIVKVVALFLLMYIKIELANKDLVRAIIDNVFWLILIFGGFIAAEPVLSKWKPGGVKNVVQQDIEQQTVIASEEEVTTKTTRKK